MRARVAGADPDPLRGFPSAPAGPPPPSPSDRGGPRPDGFRRPRPARRAAPCAGQSRPRPQGPVGHHAATAGLYGALWPGPPGSDCGRRSHPTSRPRSEPRPVHQSRDHTVTDSESGRGRSPSSGTVTVTWLQLGECCHGVFTFRAGVTSGCHGGARPAASTTLKRLPDPVPRRLGS